jgi:hypothetical protein
VQYNSGTFRQPMPFYTTYTRNAMALAVPGLRDAALA